MPHNMHEEKRYEEKFEFVERLTEFFKANFSDVSIYPLLGNHDFEISNLQDFRQPDRVLDFVADAWKDFLEPQARQSFAEVGYYVQKLKINGHTYDKVNILAVNSQPCYVMNFYLWTQRNDPGGILEWLNGTLAEMEAKGEIAIVISHIPVQDITCLDAWAARYKAIADRY